MEDSVEASVELKKKVGKLVRRISRSHKGETEDYVLLKKAPQRKSLKH